jgi:predicted phage-related endonuclease
MTVTHLPTCYTIGGSDAAAAAGIDPHKSRVMLWLEKKGRIGRPETEAMHWGKLLEPVIFEELRERGYAVTAARDLAAMPNRMFHDGRVQHPDVPWLVGHPVGLYEVEDGLGVLDAKTVGQWAKREWNGEPPLAYVAQVQHYLHLTGLDRGLLAVLVGGQRLETYEIRRNQSAIDKLLALEEEFYGFLVRDEPPPPDSSESAREAVAAMFPEHVPGRVMRLDKRLMRRHFELRARREQRDTIDRIIRGHENELKAAMGDAETAISPHDEPVIHWRTSATTRLDVQRLKTEMPDVYERYVNRGQTRRFVLA